MNRPRRYHSATRPGRSGKQCTVRAIRSTRTSRRSGPRWGRCTRTWASWARLSCLRPPPEAEKSLAPADGEPEVRSPERLLNAAMEFFRSDDWAFERLADRSALRLPFQGRNGKWSCLAHARVTAALEQLLFYSVLPLNVPDEKRHAVAEFITRANYAMAIGNFEMDFSDGEVRFKTSIDATDSRADRGSHQAAGVRQLPDDGQVPARHPVGAVCGCAACRGGESR